GGALLPDRVYHDTFGPPDQLRHGGVGGTPLAPAFANLRAVGVRLDPCFANLGDVADADCENQLRITFQPLTFEDGHVVTGDEAVHAFYSVTREELAKLGRELI